MLKTLAVFADNPGENNIPYRYAVRPEPFVASMKTLPLLSVTDTASGCSAVPASEFALSTDLLGVSHDMGPLVRANTALARRVNTLPEATAEALFAALVHPEDRAEAEAALSPLLARETASVTFEVRCQREDGASRWYHWGAARGGSGDCGCFDAPETDLLCWTIRDVTHARQSHSLQTGQSRVLELLLSGASLEITLNQLICTIEQHSPEPLAAAVFLIENDRLKLTAAPSLPAPYWHAAQALTLDPTQSTCAAAIAQGKLFAAHDRQHSPHSPEIQTLLASLDFETSWSQPIRGGKGQIIGSFAIHRTRPGLPDEAERQLMETAARLAGVAIEQGRADGELRHIASTARCLIWYATVRETGEKYLDWTVTVPMETAAQHFLPMDTSLYGSYVVAWEAAILPDDYEAICQLGADRLRGGAETYTHEFRCRDRFGAVHWLREDVRVTVSTPGHWRAVGVCTDITDLKLAQDALYASELRFRRMTDNSYDVVTLIGADGIVLYDSGSIEARSGYTAQERIGRHFAATIHPEDVEAVSRFFQELVGHPGGVATATFRFRQKSGGYVYVEAVATNLLLEPGVSGIVVNSRDVTDRKRAEAERERTDAERERYLREIEASRERYRNLFHNLPLGAYRTTPDGRVLMANHAMARLLGYDSPSELLALNMEGGDHHANYDRTAFRQHLEAQGEVRGLESVWTRRDGTKIMVRETVRVVRDHAPLSGEIASEIASLLDDSEGAVLYYEGIVEDITERRRIEDQVRWHAFHDTLTGLPNRAQFMERLEQSLIGAAAKEDTVALLFLDLDRFKSINDSLGHSAGDLLLCEIAKRLQAVAQNLPAGGGNCVVARLGGDEFTLLVPSLDSPHQAVEAAIALRQALIAPLTVDGYDFHVSGSIGISLYPFDGTDAATLFKHADVAMYRAKDGGGDGYQMYTQSMNAQAFGRMMLEASLRKGLERGEFVLAYQPQIEMVLSGAGRWTAQIVGFEALVRWQHPDHGLLPPAHFVPLAEETGLIGPLGEWILQEACRQGAAWQASGLPPLRISVNLSARQFAQRDLVALVARTLEQTGFPGQCLDLELTETALLDDGPRSLETLTRLKALGARLSLDDFGTGYSSLAYLRQFPLDTLKIDRSFVHGITGDEAAPIVGNRASDRAIVRAVVDLGRALGMEVIAEGVETPQQRDFIHDLGCRTMQGYLFGTPIPPDKVPSLLAQTEISVPG